MNDQTQETEVEPLKELKPLDEALRVLWHRVRLASEAIRRLREEKGALDTRLQDLQRHLASSQSDIARKDEEIKRLRGEQAHSRANESTNGFSIEEKDVLKGKIRELIAKINSHLQ